MGPGTSLARTKVTRCLVGTPGITYKYLGLRMFVAPWKGEEASSYAKKIRKASKKLEKRAVKHGAKPRRCRFNLTLINRMAPDALNGGQSSSSNDLGVPVSVSWHADSSLQDYSTISVYVAEHAASESNFAKKPTKEKPQVGGGGGGGGEPWKLALRVVHHVEGPGMRAAAAAAAASSSSSSASSSNNVTSS